MALFSKEEFFRMFTTDLDNFIDYLISGTATAKRLAYQIEHSEALQLDDAILRNKFVALRTAGVITTATITYINQVNNVRNTEQSGVVSDIEPGITKYRVTVPAGTPNVYRYLAGFATADIRVVLETTTIAIVKAQTGTFNYPGMVEI